MIGLRRSCRLGGWAYIALCVFVNMVVRNDYYYYLSELFWMVNVCFVLLCVKLCVEECLNVILGRRLSRNTRI